MRRPATDDEMTMLGEWYWIEVEGFEKLDRRQMGNFFGYEWSIMGWDDCKNLGDCWKKQKRLNYAPRIRYWKSETEDDAPTKEEREAAEWDNDIRAWRPFGPLRDLHLPAPPYPDRYEEFKATGRTVWDD